MGVFLTIILGLLSFCLIKIVRMLCSFWASQRRKNFSIKAKAVLNNNNFQFHNIIGRLKKTRGLKRVYLAASILWLVLVCGYLAASSTGVIKSIGLFLFIGMPVWLNWFVYWALLVSKNNNKKTNRQYLTLIVFLVLLVFAINYGVGVVILVSFPVWFFWLIYWVILGFIKEGSNAD